MALVALVAAGCSQGAADAPATAVDPLVWGQDYTLTLPMWPGRPFIVHVPPGTGGRPAPLLFVLHGGGKDATSMVKLVCPEGDIGDARCLHRVAGDAGFITAYLNGTPNPAAPRIRTWNAGGGSNGFACISNLACERNVDDVTFVAAVLDELRRRVAIDPERVYATGISNGGAMSERLACELSDRIAGVVAVAAGNQFSTTRACTPSHAVSVLEIHGTEDRLWPFAGGEMPLNPGLGIGTPESITAWAARNRCATSASTRLLDDRDPGDGTRTREQRFAGCQGGAEVALLEVQGGGHTWPGGEQYAAEAQVGRTSHDFDANAVIVDFLRTRRRF